MSTKTEGSYESIALGLLHGEFEFNNPQETDDRIRQALTRAKAGAFDPERIALLRRFKDEVQNLIGLRKQPEPAQFETSPYFVKRHGKYGDYTDYDIPRFTADMLVRYPQIPVAQVEWFVHYAVGTYYLL